MPDDNSNLVVSTDNRLLTREEFQGLAEVPAELECFANIDNANTRRAYMQDVKEFMEFTGIMEPTEFRDVTRAHVIAWRKKLEAKELAAATIRRKRVPGKTLSKYTPSIFYQKIGLISLSNYGEMAL